MLSKTSATPPRELAENSPNSARKVLQVGKILVRKFSESFREIFGEVFRAGFRAGFRSHYGSFRGVMEVVSRKNPNIANISNICVPLDQQVSVK